MKKIAIVVLLGLMVTPGGYCLAGDADTSTARKVEIIVDSYFFSPDTITVEANKPVEITLRSIASTIPHDFTIDDPKSGLSLSFDVKGGRDATFTFTPETPI